MNNGFAKLRAAARAGIRIRAIPIIKVLIIAIGAVVAAVAAMI